MGSPLGLTLANLFLVNYESKYFKECPIQFSPKYYRCYVDDIFLLFKTKDHIKKFFCYMNSRHPNIKFTCEEENDNKISFLDISITRTENKFTTSTFCKRRFSRVYLNFQSHLPTDYKKGLIDTLLHFHTIFVPTTPVSIRKSCSQNLCGRKTLFHYFSLTNVSRNFLISCL